MKCYVRSDKQNKPPPDISNTLGDRPARDTAAGAQRAASTGTYELTHTTLPVTLNPPPTTLGATLGAALSNP